jgi:hypothetical protein
MTRDAAILRSATYFPVPDVPAIGTYYGMKEFAVRDPNGYVLGFGQTLPQ